MRLYEITSSAMELQERLFEGDISEEEFLEAINSLEIENKLQDCAYMMKNIEAEAEAYKAEKERLAAREKTARNAVERLKKYVLTNLKAIAGESTKVKAGTFTLSVGKSKAVAISDVNLLPKEYLIPQDPKINKTAISKAIKGGSYIPGATLEINEYLRIR